MQILLRYDVNRHWNRMWRQAGIRIAGLVVKAALQHVFAFLRCQVGMENEFSGVNAELFLRSNLQGKRGARRKVDRSDVKPRRFDHRQPRRNQVLFRRSMGIDMKTIGHVKMKIDLGGPAGGNIDLCGIKKLDSILRGQRQRLVFEDLQPKKHQDKADH
jgi:hypothetical protein